MMKKRNLIKAVTLILLIAVILTFAAGCGAPGTKKIDSAIQGIWVFQKDLWVVGVEFKHGKAERLFTNIFGNESEDSGTYTIDTQNEEIICKWNDSNPETFQYSYDSEEKEITIWMDDVIGIRG